MSDMIRHTPSVESLKLAVELWKSPNGGATIKDVLGTASFFEGYLLGGFVFNVEAPNLDGKTVKLSDIVTGDDAGRHIPDAQTERPSYDTLRSLDGTTHRGIRTEAQPDAPTQNQKETRA